MVPGLEIQLLGDFRLTYRAQEMPAPVRIDAGRLQSLLAYLVLHSRAPQSRQHLAFRFWPDTAEAQARTNLRNLLHRLRRVLPDADTFLWSDTTLVQWRPHAPFTCDALDFEAAVAEAEAHLRNENGQAAEEALRRAVALYQGDLLPGCYDDWLLPIRERLRQAFFHALETLTRRLEARRAYDEAIGYGERWLRHDELSETAYRSLMRLYALKGDRAGALRVYHACTTALKRELGVEPGPAIQELYRRLVQGGTAAPPPRPGVATWPLVGREASWKRLVTIWEAVRHGQVPPQAVLVTGEAGIGKTRLAEEFAEWVRRQGFTTAAAYGYAAESALAYGPVATWLQRLAPTSLHDAWRVEIARLVPEVLDGHPHLKPPGPLREAWQRLRFFEALVHAVLAQRPPILLLLDDAQWADGETLDWLHYLLRYDLQARLLVVLTARSEALTPEHPLPVLTGALQERGQFTAIPLTRLDASQTTALVAHLVGRALPEEEAATLYRHTEGNPLFVVESVNSGLELVHQADAPLPQRVRAVLSAHLRQVSKEAQALAEVAAVIGRAFTTEILAAAADLDEDRFVRSLDELWQRRLIREQGPTAYEFGHDKLRQVAYEQVSPVRRQSLHRRVEEALHHHEPHRLAERAFHHERGGNRRQALALYLQAAQQEIAHSAYAVAEELLQRALTLTDKREMASLVEIWLLRAEIADVLGQHPQHEEAVTQALRLVQTAHEPTLQARVQLAAGLLATKTGRHREAAVYFQQALHLARSHDNHPLSLDIVLAWGELDVRRGDMASAQCHFEEARELAHRAQAAAQEAEALDGLGFIYPSLGEPPEKAEAALRQALTLRHATGDQLGEARSFCNLIGFLCAQGAYEQVWRIGQEALARNEAVGYRRGQAIVQGTMGMAAAAMGEFEAAFPLLQVSYEIMHELDDVVGAAIGLANLGLAAERAGDLQQAQAFHERSLKMALAHDANQFAAFARHDLARVHIKQAHWQAALDLLPLAETYFAETGDPLYRVSCCTMRGRALLALGHDDQARALCEESWHVWQQGGLEGDLLADWLWQLADLLSTLDDKPRANRVIMAAHALLEQMASTITDEARRRAFWERVQIHRRIRDAWQAI